MYLKLKENLDAWHAQEPRKPLILKGTRQVGKTYLLRSWGEETFTKVHYVNLKRHPNSANELSYNQKSKLLNLPLYLAAWAAAL